VQVGTASFADPRATERIAQGLEQWCARHHVARVAELTGALEVTPAPKPPTPPPPASAEPES
jgi:dihydroorotate dehydrogenase (NAD+) catalytic subunit